jgi:molecular chaperone GrpE
VSDAQDPGVAEGTVPPDPEVDVEAILEDELVGESADAATSVEDLVALLEETTAQRDEYLDLARRTQAEFENHRKRVAKQLDDEVVRKVAELVEQLLPVLDACDGAVAHGATEVEPIFAALLQTLEKRGLERIDPAGREFDPNAHEAVMHEPADEGQETTVVSDVMRAGYAWQGRVVRPAMVKVKG